MKDLYQITTVDPKGYYRSRREETRYGTKRKATAIAVAVRAENHHRRRWAQAHGQPIILVDINILRAPVGDFTDVTQEFMKGDQ